MIEICVMYIWLLVMSFGFSSHHKEEQRGFFKIAPWVRNILFLKFCEDKEKGVPLYAIISHAILQVVTLISIMIFTQTAEADFETIRILYGKIEIILLVFIVFSYAVSRLSYRKHSK